MEFNADRNDCKKLVRAQERKIRKVKIADSLKFSLFLSRNLLNHYVQPSDLSMLQSFECLNISLTPAKSKVKVIKR